MGRGERGFEGVGSAVDEEDGKLVGAGEGAKVEREMVVGDFHADLGIAGVDQTGGIGFGQELVAQEIAGERERILEENAVLNFDGERAFGNGGRRRVAGDGKEGGLLGGGLRREELAKRVVGFGETLMQRAAFGAAAKMCMNAGE